MNVPTKRTVTAYEAYIEMLQAVVKQAFKDAQGSGALAAEARSWLLMDGKEILLRCGASEEMINERFREVFGDGGDGRNTGAPGR